MIEAGIVIQRHPRMLVQFAVDRGLSFRPDEMVGLGNVEQQRIGDRM